MARIRTLTFLPEIFQTATNSEFLAATLDQIVNPPSISKIQGYIGSTTGYGVNANDFYVLEPTKTRTDYQLTPGVVFTNPNESTAKDFITYPGIIDALKIKGGLNTDHNKLFESDLYTWDSFTSLDKLINYNQYYWIPWGLPAVSVSSSAIFASNDYLISSNANSYDFEIVGEGKTLINPELTFLRGGTYSFTVDQTSDFWIQTEPGISGTTALSSNISTRDVYGVSNNGANTGIITFTVPLKDAQDEFDFSGNQNVDMVSTRPYEEIHGQLLSDVVSIDGITALQGLNIMFYQTGSPSSDTGYVSERLFRVDYIGNPNDPTIDLVPTTLLPINVKLSVIYGDEWVNRSFYRSVDGVITLIPAMTAILDTLYYQDGSSSNKAGKINIIDSNSSNVIKVDEDILGKKTYTAPNGVIFTNGLKVIFDSNVYPQSYASGEYYIEGVGTAIELIAVTDMVCPEAFTYGSYNPYDISPFDIGNFDANLFIPEDHDYITIARNALSKNAWSRSNRWFHADVIAATALYNDDSTIPITYATSDSKAKRPIIEFYPNLKLFDAGTFGKTAVDFIDNRETDALSNVAGSLVYYPDVEVYTNKSITIPTVSVSTTVDIDVSSAIVTGTFQIGMYLADSAKILPENAQIIAITGSVITLSWNVPTSFTGASGLELVGSDLTMNNYSVFSGARIIFANDSEPATRNKIFVANLSVLSPNAEPVITLSIAEDGDIKVDDQAVILRGFTNQGKSIFYNGSQWINAQSKITVNQTPKFDVFDKNGISFGDESVYNGTSFNGSTLFEYSIGTGADDAILGFPIKYSTVDNSGDINFNVTLNSTDFSYVDGSTPVTVPMNTGFVYNYDSQYDFTRLIGWKSAIAPSVQYQIFNFDYDPAFVTQLKCDITPIEKTSTTWSPVQVYVNNEFLTSDLYTIEITDDSSTIITLNTEPSTATVIQVMIISDQTSEFAYYDIPTNLNNNPLNDELTSVNLGDIRSQYRDIFINITGSSGSMFGANNTRDLGDLTPYGTQIVKNSASMVLPGAFLRKQEHDLFSALTYNSREYVKFKQLLVDTVDKLDFTQTFTPSAVLDTTLDVITATKNQDGAFFWTDMIPTKAPFRSNSYSLANSLDGATFPLSTTYDFSSANYNGVLVYLYRDSGTITTQTQLVSGRDYIVSETNATLAVTKTLLPGDKIIVNEYNQTYGSFVPQTPTKLGLFPAYEPSVVLDDSYIIPTYFIRGHDGSYTKLYGEYNNGILVDFRDQVLMEFETRIFNNLKLPNTLPFDIQDVLPGHFRETNLSVEDMLQLYTPSFLDWIGQNRLDYKTQNFIQNNEYTYNYRNSGNKLDGTPITQGHWRGVYTYFYDTTTPDQTPWEMLGLVTKPSWWDSRYGSAPYTSDNTVLWNDLEDGLVWNNGDSYVKTSAIRPGLSSIIPVDIAGNLVSPMTSLVGNYNTIEHKKRWTVGDIAPVEFSYRRSSSWPFDAVRLYALARPALFFNVAVDLDTYTYDAEFDQYLVNGRNHLRIADIDVYGAGKAKTSYINWIVDFEKQQGVVASTTISDMLDNIDVRLIYRLAGYSDKSLLQFFVEKGSPNSNNTSLLIPDESYTLMLYDNQPFDQLVYSSVVIQQNAGSWSVFGNGQKSAYFTVLRPINNGNTTSINVVGQSATILNDYSTTEQIVPYGTTFHSTQEVVQFLMSYSAWLKSKGMKFDTIKNGQEINWSVMAEEFLYWVQTGWEDGSILTVNPSANMLKVNRDSTIVQPLTLQNQNFILNQDLYPIQIQDTCVRRDGTEFNVHTLNQGDVISYAQFNMSNFEHGIVFDNSTVFNDVIFNLATGLRQSRIAVRGTKTAEWNGTVNAYGFILNQDNVTEWSREIKYTKGQIVRYKNKYWVAAQIVEPAATFNETQWRITDYNDIQKGMLPNAATRAYESTLFYDINSANLERDSDLLSFSLIGYRPRDYLAMADLTDITQVNVYKNMIKTKGTRNATLAFKGVNLSQGVIDYDLYENWAIKSGEYGGTLNENFIELNINQSRMTGNPSIISLTDGTPTVGSMQEVHINNLYNYSRPVNTPNIFNTVSDVNGFPDAGYVNFNDVKLSSYYYGGLSQGVNQNGSIVPINSVNVRDYIWLANFKEKWGVYSWKPLGEITTVTPNINSTSTVKFTNAHGLTKFDSVSIINFSSVVDGYYLVVDVLNPLEVTVNLSLSVNSTPISGSGIALAMTNQRVATPADIASMNMNDTLHTKNTVWVDENSDGKWAVYRKNQNFKSIADWSTEVDFGIGSSVSVSDITGTLVSAPTSGKVFRLDSEQNLLQTLSSGPTYGTSVSQAQNIIAVSEPSGTPQVHLLVLNDTALSNALIAYQAPITRPLSVTGSWGTSTVLSEDGTMLFISADDNAVVYVYEKQHVKMASTTIEIGQTYVIDTVETTDFTAIGAIENKVGITFIASGIPTGVTGTVTKSSFVFKSIIDGTLDGFASTDGFGASISVTRSADTVAISAPKIDSPLGVLDNGKITVYQRSVQQFETPYNNTAYQTQLFQLSWIPVNVTVKTCSAVNSSWITATDVTGLAVNMPIMFHGGTYGSSTISPDVVYYIHSITGSTFRIKSSINDATYLVLPNTTGISFTVYPQSNALNVQVNGTMVSESLYAVIDSGKFIFTGQLRAGDIVTVRDSRYTMLQQFTSEFTDRVGIRYSTSSAMTSTGTEMLVGSPFEIDSNGHEGAVYRYTNAGAKFGTVVGTRACNVTGTITLHINGYGVVITPGDAVHVADIINTNQITNVQASASDGILIISLIDISLAPINAKLALSATSNSVFEQLGISVYQHTQTLKCPHARSQTQFGTSVAIHSDMIAIGAPSASQVVSTTFEFTDDESTDNDTIFDNNATRYEDVTPGLGAVYVYDLLSVMRPSVDSPGAYAMSQTLISDFTVNTVNSAPRYGSSVAFSANMIAIGAPNYSVNGQVSIFKNETGLSNWSVYRTESPKVDISKIQNAQIFSATTNDTLINLDYIDPSQGKILGAVRANIDYIATSDPAQYAEGTVSGRSWGVDQVGKIWFNTSNVRYMNSHQNDDAVYNSKYWGTVFPGSDVAVYTWVQSTTPPVNYTGAGTPIESRQYVTSTTINSANIITPVYYFWVRNTNTIAKKLGKTLSDSIMASYIENPKNSGIAYMAVLLPNAVALYNSAEYFRVNESILHIGYANGMSDDVAHSEFTLVRENYDDDFLPGLPSASSARYGSAISGIRPEGLYDRLLDSMAGADETGEVVPNPYLPKAVQSGVNARPRQSFFYNRFGALKNYLTYANDILAQYPISETRQDASFLFQTGEYFDTTDYWEYANWWASGYDDSTKAAVQVSIYSDLLTLSVTEGTLVMVEQNGVGLYEIYRYDGEGVWTRICLQNGTIEFKLALWDYAQTKTGFGDNFFDTGAFDAFPSEETRNIIRALNEQIYIDELVQHRNKSLILLFEYIQSETSESSNFLPWLRKTSLVDVTHTVRELLPYTIYKSDNQEFLSGYINEVKPYHVVVKEFLFKYNGQEEYNIDVTDFDLPSTYNTTYGRFIAPQLVYNSDESDNITTFTSDSPIWSSRSDYTKWFENHGVSVTGQPEYDMTVLTSYATLGSTTISVDNAQGFPINGIIKIGDELISYASVNRATNTLGGLVRGINNTVATSHIPGEHVFIDLPAVLILDGGRGYENPPRITAKIDTTKYPSPVTEARFEAVMNADSVIAVKVLDAGKGYAVLPEIVIEPSVDINFTSADVNPILHTLRLYAPVLKTGDIVKFNANSASVDKLVDNTWYYVNVLENVPSAIVALYTSYSDAINDNDRIQISSSSSDTITMKLSMGARASAITTSSPIRENNINMRFDRTTYGSQVLDWEAGSYYGSYFAGNYNNTTSVASSSITLSNEYPDVSTIRASAQGIAFEIENVQTERTVDWSSFIRYVASTDSVTDTVRLVPLDSGINPLDPEPNASGSTIGFYENMPVKFTGDVIGGLTEGVTYYVKEVISDIDFTISASENGSIVSLSDAVANTEGMECITSDVTDVALLTVNYPGILQVTKTESVTNVMTVPVSAIGTGGTQKFYTNLPVFFTDNAFGGVTTHVTYYVTSILDNERFTVSATKNPLMTAVTSTDASSDRITLSDIDGFSINNPVVFAGNMFGSLTTDTIYYVGDVYPDTNEITLYSSVNGAIVPLTSATGNAKIINQKDTLALIDGTGSMTMNVSLPVSPGQIDGQSFTLFDTSGHFSGVNTGAISDLIERDLTATIGAGHNLVAFNRADRDKSSFFYTGMPVRVSSNIGGLTTGTTYYVMEYSGMPDGSYTSGVRPNIEINVFNTEAGTNQLTCNDTSLLYVGMPLVFDGVSLGGIVIDQEYYVKTIVNGTKFTVSTTKAGATTVLTSASGVMIGSGDPYVVLTATLGGTTSVIVTDALSSDTLLTQYPTSDPEFDISYKLGGYRAIVTVAGSGFAVSNKFTVPGTILGGKTPLNDAILTINEVSDTGQIIDVACSGKVADMNAQYYLKVRSNDTLAVYTDPLMEVPANPANFTFKGFTTTTVTALTASTDSLTVGSTSGFMLNDEIIFTGTTPNAIIDFGIPYYVLEIVSGTSLKISTVPGSVSDIVNILSDSSVNFTCAKAGSYALLPEPFYFNQSIVRFNNRVYVCVISNNDDEFIFGKWELLDSGDRRLNAMDRTIGYYQPTANMPGVDITQLFDGVTFPNPIYMGNAFEPDRQFEVDVDLLDQPFYPTDIDMTAITWDGSSYMAAANLPTYSAILKSDNGSTWSIDRVSNSNLGLTDIVKIGNLHVMTSSNTATPLFRSNDAGVTWTTSGSLTTIGSSSPVPITVSAVSLESVAYGNGIFVAVGDTIVRSTDSYAWNEVLTFDDSYHNRFYDVEFVTLPSFTGFIAVGIGSRIDTVSGIIDLVPTDLVYSSTDGITWSPSPTLSSYGFKSLASNGTKSVTIGEAGRSYYTQNGYDWLGSNEVSCVSVDTLTLNVTNTAGFTIGDPIGFSTSFSPIHSDVTYYVHSIISPTQIRITKTLAGSPMQLAGTINAGSFVIGDTYIIQAINDGIGGSSTDFTLIGASSNIIGTSFIATGVGTGTGYASIVNRPIEPYTKMALLSTPNVTMNAIIYANSIWLSIGDNGVIRTSADGIKWVSRSSGVNVNLNSVTYNTGIFTVVGDNNAILSSADNGLTWESASFFTIDPTQYDIKGADFPYGYGPEELVPGNLTDNFTMFVTTRPGSSWSGTEYAYTGFRVESLEVSPSDGTQTVYSFDDVCEVPAQIGVQIINEDGFGTTLARNQYTVNWVDKTITLQQPLPLSPALTLRIDVFEVGNGNQLVKSSTDSDIIQVNADTGFNEVMLNCNYTGSIFNGGGIMQPGSTALEIKATATDEVTNRIYCDDVSKFVINNQISFQGLLFGGVVEDYNYFIKTISVATNSITISDTYNTTTGQAGPTLSLTTATGDMTINANTGNGNLWSEAMVLNNGVKMVNGVFGNITRLKSGTNSIVTNSIGGVIVGSKIMFSDSIMGDIIQPMTTYYVHSIVDANEFAISETVGGPILVLDDATGGASFITGDYAFGVQTNGISAKMIFASNSLTNSTNYIVYSVFGETTPDQYGYSIPEFDTFTGNGTTTTFSLNNNLGTTNTFNAIVEINGLRQNPTGYTIDELNSTITFSVAPILGSDISVMTYNDTTRQYLSTQYDITGAGLSVASIVNINNTITRPLAYTNGIQTESTGWITVSSVNGFIIDQTVLFKGTGFGGLLTDGTVYFVDQIDTLNGKFSIKDYDGNPIILTDATGIVKVQIGGTPTTRITTGSLHNFIDDTRIRIDGVEGSYQLNNNIYYAKVIDPYTFDIYNKPYDVTINSTNFPVTEISSYVSGGFAWKTGLFYLTTLEATASSSSNNRFTTASNADLVVGTPVYFSELETISGEILMGDVESGLKYYVKELFGLTQFTVSETVDGPELALTTDTGTLNVTQWKQTTTDRIWVTVNGLRVPSARIRLNDVNELSILVSIEPGDEVIITNMIPTATPNEMVYMNIVDSSGDASVYRTNSRVRTWVTQPVHDLSTEIHLQDASKVTTKVEQSVIVPAEIAGYYYIGLAADKNILTDVSVRLGNGTLIDPDLMEVIIVDTGPVLKISSTAPISAGNTVLITSIEGELLYINGEQIRFGKVDLLTNTVSDLSRGVNGTGKQGYVQSNTEVYGLLSENLMSSSYYNQTWNSNNIDPIIGDPLQISDTDAGLFLN